MTDSGWVFENVYGGQIMSIADWDSVFSFPDRTMPSVKAECLLVAVEEPGLWNGLLLYRDPQCDGAAFWAEVLRDCQLYASGDLRSWHPVPPLGRYMAHASVDVVDPFLQ